MRTNAERAIAAAESAIWAIEESKLVAIGEFLSRRKAGEAWGEAELRERVGSVERGREARGGGVAVVPLFGVIAHRMGSLHETSGGTSTERFTLRLEEILSDEAISSIVLDVSSPGGTVYGVAEAAQRLYEARGSKKIIAVANAQMASAAYWIGSAADEIVVLGSGDIGSIGVFALHQEESRALDKEGVTTRIIRAGRFKAEANQFEPLTDEAAAAIQRNVDDYYALFTEGVARHRGVALADVVRGYGEGRALVGKRAVRAGLADRVGTLEGVLEELGVRPATIRESRRAQEEEVDVRAAEEPIELVAIDRPALVSVAGSRFGTTPGEVAAEFAREVDAEILSGLDGSSAGPHSARAVHVLPRATEDEGGVEDEEEEEKLPPDDEATETPEVPAQEAGANEEEDDEEEVDGDAGGPSSESQDPVKISSESAPGAGEETVEKDSGTGTPKGAGDGTSVATVRADAQATERQRARQIHELAAEHGVSERAGGWIESGKSVEAVGLEILNAKEAERPGSTLPKQDPPVVLTERENERYSIKRLISALADGNAARAGFEMEVSAELERVLGRSPTSGVFVPTTLQGLPDKFRGASAARREGVEVGAALTTTGATSGEELVFIEPGSFISLLRSRMVLPQMGATFLPGLRGNVDFPKQTGAGAFSWVPESSGADDPVDSDLSTGTVSLRPKNGRSITSFSRTQLAQSVINVEQLVRSDLAAIGARGLDLAALHGTGADNQPEGLYVASGVNAVAFGGGVSFAKVVEMETAIAEADADVDRMGYVTTPSVRGAAKTTLNFAEAAAGMAIWTGSVREGEMNGYRAMASTQVASDLGGGSEHGILFGAWEHLLVGEWGAAEILVDPYTRAGRGLVRVLFFLIADIALRYPEAFSKGTGLTVAGAS